MSTTIYSSEKSLPYVYKGIHRETGEFYIGYRYANKKPSTEDLGNYYFTSSNQVKKIVFEKFDWIIIAEFFDKDSAWDFENLLIKDNFRNPLNLNRHIWAAIIKCWSKME
jgi:hypothetical protein